MEKGKNTMKCICCNKQVPPWMDYCADCEEEIQTVYVQDSQYVSFLKGIHPASIPNDFMSVNYSFLIDIC